MTPIPSIKRLTVPELSVKRNKEKIVCLTAYTAPMARLLDPHVDILLVGDSLGMVLYGMESTLPVTLEMMAAHGAAAVRGSRHACVVVDLPFGSYQESPAQALRSATTLLKETGAQAVKLEGGAVMAPTITFLVERGIPVMGHIGLQPQSVHRMGGYRTQGRDGTSRAQLLTDAKAIGQSGAFSLVIEGTVEPLARQITESVPIPTIGIGASPACDGQVLVTEDMLGLFERTAGFVKRYVALNEIITAAAAEYAAEVRSGLFPDASHYTDTRRV